MGASRRRRAGIQAALLLAAACNGSSPTAPTGPSSATTTWSHLSIRTVSGAVGPVDLQVGQSDELAAFLHRRDGTQGPAASVTWRSEDSAVATVTADGTVTGQAIGETLVWANAADGLAGYVDVNVAHASRPVDPRFDDRYWRELVFDGHDKPSAVASAVTQVLETPSPHFYIRLDNTGWPDWPSDSLVARMREAIPRLAEQLTGQPYRGRIETGDADRKGALGYVVVVFETQSGACGRARIGADPGRIWMSPPCFSLSDEGALITLFAHEVGHAFGFHHVSDYKAVMRKGALGYRPGFTAPEEYHARLAYDVGRGHPYVGWPFPSAFGPTEVSQDWPTSPRPVIVVDD